MERKDTLEDEHVRRVDRRRSVQPIMLLERIDGQLCLVPSFDLAQFIDEYIKVDRMWSIKVVLIQECDSRLLWCQWLVE